MTRLPVLAMVLLTALAAAPAPALEPFQPADVCELEWAADPRLSPDGKTIVYVRSGMDRWTDRPTGALWTIGVDGSGHRPLGAGGERPSSPRFSPDGSRLAYVAGGEHGRQIWVRWMESGESAPLTRLEEGPGDVTWSPDGSMLAFTAFVPAEPEPFAKTLTPPEGGDWAPKAKVIDRLIYRRDGGGYTEAGNTQLFVVPAEGGTPRRLTDGPYDHGDPAWTPDGRHLLVVSNRRDDWEYDPQNTEIYEVALADGSIRALTDRHGPDEQPAVSPDGTKIAYRGFDDRYQGFQVRHLYVMDRDGSNPKRLTESLDRGVSNPTWSADGSSILVSYSTEGNGRIAAVGLDGSIRELARDLGGLSLGRPYSSGSFTAGPGGAVVFTHTRPDHPADLAVAAGGTTRRLTRLNDDLTGQRELAEVEELWVDSSHDGRRVQGWLAKPPGFDPAKKYPLILEIHGGPFANYGDRFAAEVQLYAAAGYLVLYANPRGSTSYGEEFGNLIHHAYPGDDYHDLMSAVDAVVERGWADPGRLYVTGGSGGGVLTAWIVGHTDRFAAAASQKPVINWASWALTADIPIVAKYWFPVPPWEDPDGYWKRSPLAYVGNVTTPTMVVTGEVDYRTPISESEQFYQALKMRKVPSVLVRIPEASHGIAARPSHLLAKVAHVLEWFARYGGEDEAE